MSQNLVSRRSNVLVGMVVSALTLVCMQRAMSTTVVPSAALVSYNLAAGATSAAIAVASDKPVFVVANSTTSGERGTANMSVEKAAGAFLEWAGINSITYNSGPTLSGGFNGAGATMLTIDYSGQVVINVGASSDTMVVHNGWSGTATGVLLIIS